MRAATNVAATAGAKSIESAGTPSPSLDGKLDQKRYCGRVLLAEDNPVSLYILRYFLENAGFTVETTGTGRETAAQAVASSFDVILMDMEMPEMDGYEATTALRLNGYKGAIVALTANARPGDEERCLAVGCDSYLSKPVPCEVLVEEVVRHLPLRGPTPATSSACQTVPPVSPATTTGYLEPSKLMASYRRTLPNKMSAMAQALQDSDWPVLIASAHKLAGSAGMYGLPRVSEAASLLEEACRINPDHQTLTVLFERLQQTIISGI